MTCTAVQADNEDSDNEPHLYLGGGLSSLALDNDRVPGVPTSSPSHTSKMVNLILGYQINKDWSADLTIATEVDNVSTDQIAVNGYRFFGSSSWRPFVSAGFSNFSIDSAPDDSTQQFQAGFGISGDLNRNLELRVGYQVAFTVSGDNFNDDILGAALLWHFRKPPMMAAAEPAMQVIETYELQVQFDFDKSDIKTA